MFTPTLSPEQALQLFRYNEARLLKEAETSRLLHEVLSEGALAEGARSSPSKASSRTLRDGPQVGNVSPFALTHRDCC
jgi:hypothetical protein